MKGRCGDMVGLVTLILKKGDQKKNRTLLFPYNSFFHTYRKEVNLYTSESIIFGIQH